MKDFLLEHYKVVNERLTQSDRNRDVWVGAYLVLTVGSLSFALTSDSKSLELKLIILGFLFLFGIFVTIYVAIARAWHCEYTNVLIAIHRAFLNGDLDLLKAAREFKQSKEFKHYFRWGTEFTVFLLMLLCLSLELLLILWAAWSCILLYLSPLLLLPFLSSIPAYRCYLNKRERKFPNECYSIQAKAEN